jgi:hypothetical protein
MKVALTRHIFGAAALIERKFGEVRGSREAMKLQ